MPPTVAPITDGKRVITRELCWAQLQLLDEELQRTWNEKHAAAVELQRNWGSTKLKLLEATHASERVLK
jgi:hypothetical protein